MVGRRRRVAVVNMSTAIGAHFGRWREGLHLPSLNKIAGPPRRDGNGERYANWAGEADHGERYANWAGAAHDGGQLRVSRCVDLRVFRRPRLRVRVSRAMILVLFS